MDACTALIVDDEADIRELIEMTLLRGEGTAQTPVLQPVHYRPALA